MLDVMPTPHSPPRILVVDDDEAKRYTIVRPLKSLGVEIEEATSAAQALELARSDPDLIILDVKLPDGSGFEVCERIKADPATAPIPVLYVSAVFRTPEDRVRGLKGGADGYLVTPINREELVATVEVWLRARAAERDRRRLTAALERERAFLEQVIDQLPVAVLIADAPDGRLLFTNHVARELYGPALQQIGEVVQLGRLPVRPVEGGSLRPEEHPLVRALHGEKVQGQELHESFPGGPDRVFSNSAAPVRDPSGALVGAVLVFEEVTERKQDEEQLRRVGQLREELIGILGHDLRNPVQAIKMSLHLLESSALPFRQQNAVTRIHSSTERMRRMIDDMVDFASSRLGGRIHLRPVELELSEVISEVLQELESVHPSRILVRERLEAVQGTWDPDRLAQVASNLIGNALQHSPADSPVTVRLWGEGGLAVLEVHNGGRPIPLEDQKTLFAPFRRGAQAQANRGVGLGLYITDQIVLAHRGKISVRSTAERGTTFRVELPLQSALS